MKFLSSEAVPYLCKCTTLAFVEYCYYVWADAPNCSLDKLDKLQKQACRIVGPVCRSVDPTFPVEPLAHHLIEAYLKGFLVDVHLNLPNWFQFLILMEGPPAIFIDHIIYLSPLLYVIKMSILTVSFLIQLDSGILFQLNAFFFFNWDSLHARLHSHCKAWSYKKKKHNKY